jgi:hypothetical protein
VGGTGIGTLRKPFGKQTSASPENLASGLKSLGEFQDRYAQDFTNGDKI